MKANKLILTLGLAAVAALGTTGCGPAGEKHVCNHICDKCGLCTDASCNDPVCSKKCKCVPEGQVFTNALKDVLKGKKFVLTCVGYEGLGAVQTMLEEDFGYNPVSTVAAMKNDTDFACSKLLDLSTIPDDYYILCAVAYTGKGLGEGAATDIGKERTRADAMAQKKNVIVIEAAGAACRGENADALLGKIVPTATAVMYKAAQNKDGFFNTYASSGKECYECEGYDQFIEAFEFLGLVSAL